MMVGLVVLGGVLYSIVFISGCGEHLVRTFLARECGEALSGCNHPLQELQRVMKERFAESEFLAGVPEKLGGAICMQVKHSRESTAYFFTFFLV